MSAPEPRTRPQIDVYVLPMAHPADWSGLEALIAQRLIGPHDIVAVLGKTEGNGCVNDFTRAYATASLETFLRAQGLSTQAFPVIVMSGGTEGALSPHATIFVRRLVSSIAQNGAALMIGAQRSAPLLPEDLGTLRQVELVAETVRACLAAADLDQVAFVQVKCPLLTAARVADAHRRGKQVVSADMYHTMALSRAASALGVALALGEIDTAQLTNEAIGTDWTLFSQVASTSSGIELMHHEVFALGVSRQATGDLRIGHAVMRHPLDQSAFEQALCQAAALDTIAQVDKRRIVQVLAKAEAPPAGQIFNARHTMLEDSDIPHSRMARAVVGGVLAAAAERTQIYVSGGAEHQGPAGGGPVAVIYRTGGGRGPQDPR